MITEGDCIMSNEAEIKKQEIMRQDPELNKLINAMIDAMTLYKPDWEEIDRKLSQVDEDEKQLKTNGE